MTTQCLEQLKTVDVRTVNRDELVDINTIEIDETLKGDDRAREFLRQVKNPFALRLEL